MAPHGIREDSLYAVSPQVYVVDLGSDQYFGPPSCDGGTKLIVECIEAWGRYCTSCTDRSFEHYFQLLGGWSEPIVASDDGVRRLH
jgi:hypothetical protein